MSPARRDKDFDGKVAFVTGAASGIGRAAALAFARKGAHVAVADVANDENLMTARLIEEAGGRSLAVRCDNNAGVEPKKLVPTAEVDEQEWDRIIGIDLRGVFLYRKYEILQ
ncbi:MAG: dehydrogenase, short-chain alcohol dehydrogenase like protein [Polyangiaceae bacterium]|jgi:NAD(P)-dependent dehydrogenase (short-subunit alcohol dehydrogenase family)|nr:dehydrogenase, short-chain alcohol dehydrogenase like protein [Polyangiaceae bacterium]